MEGTTFFKQKDEIQMNASLNDLKEKVALSCRILAHEGLIEGILGHVSVRVPGSDEMLIRCRSEDERGVLFTQSSDIRRVNFDGQGLDVGETHVYEVPKELPIHGEMCHSCSSTRRSYMWYSRTRISSYLWCV